jgi:DMSO/TMAO reductase YedYZ molybdopterin-dependent catalytic subunit
MKSGQDAAAGSRSGKGTIMQAEQQFSQDGAQLLHLLGIALMLVLFTSCKPAALSGFPDFITKNKDYFITRIDDVPEIDAASYRLKVSGLVNAPGTWSLAELRRLKLVSLPVTIECIGNPPVGSFIGTAVWKGFKVYDFLVSLGLDDRATGVKYTAADGYYASHTLDQLKNGPVIGALYMNSRPLPPEQGFPLRIINPGFYGAKQPAWVVEIEVIDRPLEDFWQDRWWDVSPPMPVDSTIFFPEDASSVSAGIPVEIGGAAFGGTRIKRVDVTADGGATWQEADIIKSMDADNVWVFWKAEVIFEKPGVFILRSRTTDSSDNVQPEADPESQNGNNAQPAVTITVQ